ncbi:uncharacterized protein LOC143177498 [Calliopsis andreniformis]|uniref:uncharacterized protein LOC143177498 n=1 Tax=Calliopsis andreniformis TaxID=337506 RepID=UPI003FCE86B5
MPGCAAVGCNNRSEKGYIMKCFPRDPELRKIWQERVARADWEPSNNSFLCHVHFKPQEWSITQSGRIRLKKNAVPSIFTITSTRKSLKKKTKIFHIIEEGKVLQSEYSTECMGNATAYSSIGHLEEKDSDFQDIDEQSIRFTQSEFKSIPESIEEEEEEEEENEESINSDLQAESIIMISDEHLTDINGRVKEDTLEPKMNDSKEKTEPSLTINNSESTEVSSAIVKKEIKLENMDYNTLEDSYDEIEEKLKQICDGGSTEDERCKKEKRKLMSQNQKEKDVVILDTSDEFNKEEHKAAMPVDTNQDISAKSEVDQVFADKEENVEIIFGVESGDEKMSISPVKTKINKVDENPLEYNNIISIKDEKKIFNEDIEENFSKEEVHVIPNIRAAMKRKKRTREEIMKSIKKSIRSTSDQDVHSFSNSELSSIDQETEIRNESSMSLQEISDVSKKNDTDVEATKFVIKVTGDPDDVSEIIRELSVNTTGTHGSTKFGTLYKHEEDNAFVTSVITVLSPKNSKEITYNNLDSPLIKSDYITLNKNISIVNHSSCEEREFITLDVINNSKQCYSPCVKHTSSDEESKNQIRNNFTPQKCIHNIQSPIEHNTKCCISPDREDLLIRLQIQEDVIEKLTDQLIIYKELENNTRNKNIGRDIESKELETPRISTRSSNTQSSIVTKKILESKQRLIEDLSNRVNYFEEMNKKLMKTVTLESQQKRKLEGQIRQKDNRIKELNWKLEKASKYLERAEKNTNTYRRKMLNMQTIMRRRKLLDEKMSKFSEMLIDSSKQEYSEKALTMAADIRKSCGRNGYDKLLSYGFPLPPLPALRKGILNEDVTDQNKSDIDKIRNSSTKLNVKKEEVQDTNNESELDEKNSELPDTVAKTEYDGAETVTGTVQDIFDENNDGDDFSTNELREHFILQLNAVM